MGTNEDAIRAEAHRLAMSRRRFLGRAGTVLAGAAIAPAVLAACGSSGGAKAGGGGGGGKAVTISNWPEYIAKQSKTDFTKDTGIALTYHEDINDNNEYFAKIRPNMSRDQSIGTDGFVLTDWMANRVINQVKWTQPLVASAFPNKSNLRTALAHPAFDPQRASSAPWASGVSGIAYNTKSTGGKEIGTLADFLAVSGTTTVLS